MCFIFMYKNLRFFSLLFVKQKGGFNIILFKLASLILYFNL